MKELVRGFGMDPEKVLVKEAIAEAHRGAISGSENVEAQIQALLKTMKQGATL